MTPSSGVELPASPLPSADRVVRAEPHELSVATLADRQLLDHVAPTAVVVRSTGHIVRFYGSLERFMTLPAGDATLDVLTLARDAVKPLVRAALHDAVRRHSAVVSETIEVMLDRKRTPLRLTVLPLRASTAAEHLWLIVFETLPTTVGPTVGQPGRRQADLVHRLEAELRAVTRDQPHLTTLNSQLQDKVSELTAARDDLSNLLISTDIATVFLDADLRVKRFTTAASSVLNLRTTDVGRPISHIAPNLVNVDLAGIARTVLTQLTGTEAEAVGQDGRWFIARALPYRTEENTVQGVVLTFVDVTTLKQAAVALETARTQLADDLRRMNRLHSVALDQLRPTPDLAGELRAILGAARDITGADFGTIQLADGQGALTIAAHVGFGQPFLDHFARVDARSDSMCGRAVASRQRVMVDDLAVDSLLADAPRLALQAANVRAIQATPLFASTGALVGMLSTAYRTPHHFDEAETRWLDLLATRAGFAIERHHVEGAVAHARHDLEQRVYEQARDLQNALDGAAAGTWHIDLRTNTVRWDARSRSIFGSATPTRPFDPTFGEVHADDRPRLQQRFAELQAPGDDQWNMTFRVPQPNGTLAWIHGVGRVERDEAGRPVRFSGINVDVTAQQRAADELRAARQRQSEAAEMIDRLLAGAAEGILATTAAGIIERANVALERMFGYAAGELTGQPLERLIPEALRARHAASHTAYWTSPQSRPMGQGFDLAGCRKDGTTFPIEVSLTPVPTTAGRQVLAFVSDITDRRRAEDALRQSNAALQAQADQLRHRTDQLRRLASELTLSEQQTREQLAKVVHDRLQQTLFSAKLRADRLGTAPPDAPGTRELVHQVREDLEAAIVEARSLSVELFPPTLHQDGLGAALAWLANWMREKYGLTVDVSVDPRATLELKDLRTLAFETVRELLFNVVKHAQVARAVVQLTRRPDDALQIVVADEGVGFEPPTAFDTHTHASGWGLFSVRERVDLLGGQMDVQSAPGRGAIFTIIIPRSEAGRRTARRALRILLADDHAVARAGLREMLTARPEFEIVGEAATGAEAIALALALKPDAIVMDVSMPDVDGIEATRRIHAELPMTQIFGLSTQERPEGLHAIEAAGAAGYFTKGDDARHLTDRLLSLCAAHPFESSPLQS